MAEEYEKRTHIELMISNDETNSSQAPKKKRGNSSGCRLIRGLLPSLLRRCWEMSVLGMDIYKSHSQPVFSHREVHFGRRGRYFSVWQLTTKDEFGVAYNDSRLSRLVLTMATSIPISNV